MITSMIKKRPILKFILIVAAAVIVIHLFSAIFIDTRLQYKHISYTSSRIPESLSGYRVVFLTDIHNRPLDELETMVERINGESPELVLLGGDFGLRKDLPECMGVLAGIQAPDGIYGVEGNHDDAAILADAMGEYGMTLLENSGAPVHDGLYIAGLEDLWNRTPDMGSALAEAAADSFVIALAHNPDTSMEIDCSGADLMLSGHTHGGEATFLGLWAPAMPFVSNYGQRFTSGWCKGKDGLDVFVSRGIGPHVVRVFARPQVIFLTLYAE